MVDARYGGQVGEHCNDTHRRHQYDVGVEAFGTGLIARNLAGDA